MYTTATAKAKAAHKKKTVTFKNRAIIFNKTTAKTNLGSVKASSLLKQASSITTHSSKGILAKNLSRGQSFQLFGQLPIEIRYMIWNLTLNATRPSLICDSEYLDDKNLLRHYRPVPVVLQICRETRKEFMTKKGGRSQRYSYHLCDGLAVNPYRNDFKLYAIPEIDVVFAQTGRKLPGLNLSELSGLIKREGIFRQRDYSRLRYMILGCGIIIKNMAMLPSFHSLRTLTIIKVKLSMSVHARQENADLR